MLAAIGADRYAKEIIVIVDGYDDGSLEYAQSVAATDPRFRPIWQENKGESIGRQNGAVAATGDIVLFMDDEWWPDQSGGRPRAAARGSRRSGRRRYMPTKRPLPGDRSPDSFTTDLYADEYERTSTDTGQTRMASCAASGPETSRCGGTTHCASGSTRDTGWPSTKIRSSASAATKAASAVCSMIHSRPFTCTAGSPAFLARRTTLGVSRRIIEEQGIRPNGIAARSDAHAAHGGADVRPRRWLAARRRRHPHRPAVGGNGNPASPLDNCADRLDRLLRQVEFEPWLPFARRGTLR